MSDSSYSREYRQEAYPSHSETRRRKVNIAHFDYTLLILLILLIVFGLIVLYSTSYYTGIAQHGSAVYWVKRQGVFCLIGFAGMFGIYFVNHRRLRNASGALFLFTVLLLGIVLFAGSTSNGSTRWINVMGFSFQPSEFGKITMIIIFAATLNARYKQMNRSLKVTVVSLIPALILVGLVGIENLSTALIYLVIAAAMVFVAMSNWRYELAVLACGGLLGTVLMIARSYRSERVSNFSFSNPTEEQTIQSIYAIGSGGISGKGLGQSMQKTVLPEAHNDMIFAIICEELGFIGALLLLLMYVFLIIHLIQIAVNAGDLYSSLVVIGITAHISVQLLINLAVATNLIPNTGVPLPFISYGGSSIIATLWEMGLAFSVARDMYGGTQNA